MKKPFLTVAAILLAVPTLGGIAYAAAHSVSDTPAPHRIFPVSSERTPTTEDNGVDDPATHDVGDDHGVDDPATHDVGDDHGGTASTTAVTPTTSDDAGDDHGGESGSGRNRGPGGGSSDGERSGHQ